MGLEIIINTEIIIIIIIIIIPYQCKVLVKPSGKSHVTYM
jgi:hypothetical protein